MIAPVPWRPAASAAAITAATAMLLWPALVTGAPWAFADTASYHRGGAVAWGVALDALGLSAPEAPRAPGAAPPPDAEARPDETVAYGIRSVPFSLFLHATERGLGVWGPVVLMTLAVAGTVLFALRDVPLWARLAVVAGLAATTALPFFAVVLQPDMLTALVVLIPLVVMLQADRLGGWALLGLFALMAAATLTHYGNLPLAGLALCWLAVWGIRTGRTRVAVLSGVPMIAAAVAGLAVGAVIGTGPSLTPGRFPFLLARSIDDGPGLVYLEARCGQEAWTICEVYDELPDDVGGLLWGADGLERRATPDQLRRIGAEEVPLVLDILRHDPSGQLKAFLDNASRQFLMFDGTAGWPARYETGPGRFEIDRTPFDQRPHVPATAQQVVLAVGALALLWQVARARPPGARATAGFLLLALLVYAAVCGGLSAPAPRYQARLVWLVPLLAVMLLARSRRLGVLS